MFRERTLLNGWGAWATKSRGKPAAICGYLPVSTVSTMSPFPITTRLKWERWLEFLAMWPRILKSVATS